MNTDSFMTTVKVLLIISVSVFAIGCHRSDEYRIVNFSEPPPTISVNPNLGHKFVLTHNGVRIIANCWIPEHHVADTSCLALKAKVGVYVRLETLKIAQDVLIYRPNGPNTQPVEMLQVASASTE